MHFKSMLNFALRQEQIHEFIRRTSTDYFGITDEVRLARFNEIWQDAYENVPFYSEWKTKHDLPSRIDSLSELSSWPILEKRELILNAEKLVRPNYKGPVGESVTGGSTGEPLHFGVWPDYVSYAVNGSLWLGWGQWGVYPDSRVFLIWGNRIFHGRGLHSKFAFSVRRIKDWMTNRYRVDATNLSQHTLEKDVKALLRYQPEVIISYSASLLALCKALPQYAEACRQLHLKAVLCTAGPLTKEERQFIGAYFGCPVAMEYGSMEAGMIAYMTPALQGRYAVFQATHCVHAIREPNTGYSEVLVTKLYPCYLPLIRYRIRDFIKGESLDANQMVTSFNEVFGRAGDEVELGNGIRFHGQSFMTCAEGFDQIIAYQLRIQRKKRKVAFIVQTIAPLSSGEMAEIKKRASFMSGLAEEDISIEVADDLVKSPSGKIRLVIEE